MLKTTNSHKINDVVILKIATGEIVIGKYVGNSEGSTILIKPVSLIQDGKGGLNLIDFIYGGDKNSEVFVTKESIIAITKALPELAIEYGKMTTDIIVPPKPALIV